MNVPGAGAGLMTIRALIPKQPKLTGRTGGETVMLTTALNVPSRR